MKDFGEMCDHDILVVIATKQMSLQDTLNDFIDRQGFFNAQMDERVRDLEVNGSKITQEHCKELDDLNKRVGNLEEFTVAHEATVRETTRIAAIVAGIIAAVGVVFTVFYTMWRGPA
jgi:CHASE3 domain sensor protein